MTLLSKIADRLTLVPSTQEIDPGENRRECIFSNADTEIEAFVSTWEDFAGTPAQNRLIILKIPGTGGRAERASVHPAELLASHPSDGPFVAAEVWTLNHRGYGGSTGPSSMQNFVSTLESFWGHIESKFPAEQKLITGNSLGCISALYLAREKNVSGLLLRNPPPVAQLIATRPKYNWWSLGAAKLIAKAIPSELDAIENAKHTTCPAVFVTSEKDRLVPPSYQQRIIDACAGATKQIILEGADHQHPPPDHQRSQYAAAIDWLRQQIETFEN